ncbi:MAG: hypothetical protein ACKO8Z_08580 [Prosthecobacter sp.]
MRFHLHHWLFILLFSLNFAAPAQQATAPAPETPAKPAADETSEVEALCGPTVITIGDAWEFITLERERARLLISSGDLAEWPQRIAALVAHARFIAMKAYFLHGEPRAKMQRSVAALAAVRLSSSQTALAGRREVLAEEWTPIENQLDDLAALLPPGALVPTSKLAHLLPPSFSTTALSLLEPLSLTPGEEQRVRFKAERWLTKGRPLLLPEHLLDLHGQRMHAFIAETTMQDYHHLHPQPTGVPGEYECRFTPRLGGQYRLWINQVPLDTGREEFPHLDLRKPERYPIVEEKDRHLAHEASVDGMKVKLSFNAEVLRPDSLYAGRLEFTDAQGQPVDDLEPFMGAYAHLVAFAEDFYLVQHLHPHGAVPREHERGGPVIEFPFKPALPCWWKVFVQVQRGGKVITLPLGLRVEWPR